MVFKFSGLHHLNGFTLIEVMLVLLIMSMLAGTVTLGVSQRTSLEFSSELNRLHRMISQANDRALMRQEIVGFFISEEGSAYKYEFKIMDAETRSWKSLRLPHWQLHELPPGIQLDVDISNKSSPESSSKSQSALAEALLIFTPDGQYTPFKLNFESDQRGMRTISGDGFSTIIIRDLSITTTLTNTSLKAGSKCSFTRVNSAFSPAFASSWSCSLRYAEVSINDKNDV